jgi:hypothetical protein
MEMSRRPQKPPDGSGRQQANERIRLIRKLRCGRSGAGALLGGDHRDDLAFMALDDSTQIRLLAT